MACSFGRGHLISYLPVVRDVFPSKHRAHVAEIATELPFPLITRLPNHLFPESEENTQCKPDGSALKMAVYLLSMPRVAH